MEFTFSVPTKVIFGAGSSRKIGEVLQSYQMKKVFCVFDRGVQSAGIVDRVVSNIHEAGIETILFDKVQPNPEDQTVEQGAALARETDVDGVVAIGGGSSMDCAKAINVLLSNPGQVRQYFGRDIVSHPTKPLIAIPTTAGTGSEVTDVAVITDTIGLKKKGISGRHVSAAAALVDPELTYGLPPAITAATGMDALTHAIESFVSKEASVPTDLYALQAIEYIFRHLGTAYRDGSNVEARSAMMLGNVLAGMAFNSAHLGLVHAIAHPLSVHCGLPHGVANASVLPYVMEYNAQLKTVAQKYGIIAKTIGLGPEGLAEEEASAKLVEAVKRLAETVNIPSLGQAGVKREQFERIAEDALKEVVLRTNPRETNKEDIIRLLEAAY
ncbi:iron-containing alcohol dehydrogenase family protein [Brevibacillus sp. B_LB10_24]|uniref:iron-containing alcohol dehydrogenase family protein n=1 Tax=Brevibacillus sp. B_LB10_24 TaxID=3380645 RepID=UPI0038BE1618